MRSTAATMLNSHFNSSQSNGKISRVEFLPIYWYDALRNEAVGEYILFWYAPACFQLQLLFKHLGWRIENFWSKNISEAQN